MKFIEFDRHKCDDCYKCLRLCPTKAIAFSEGDRRIMDKMCIKCGLCQASCPNGALHIQNDIDHIKRAISMGRRMAVSLAPSFVCAFDMEHPGQMVTCLKRLGFSIIEETAEGAEIISREYADAIESAKMETIITTCCPSATYLIEHYYPNQIPAMLPIVSPMIAHGRLLKERYGRDCFTVFMGPCLAKKAEAEELAGAIDAVLTFNELAEWIQRAEIPLNELEPWDFDNESSRRGRAYPIGSSIRYPNLQPRITPGYRYMHVNGIERCREIMTSLEEGNLKNYCIEMNICKGSCINGPDYPAKSGNFYEREDRLHRYVTQHKDIELLDECDRVVAKPKTARGFTDKSWQTQKASVEDLDKILRAMGKYLPQDQLNCGACGYSTCLEKADAVHNGISDIHVCLPYLRHRAENLQTAVFQYTRNLILVLNENLEIVDANPAFMSVFAPETMKAKDFPVSAFMDDTLLHQILATGRDLIGHKVQFKALGKEFYMNGIYLKMEKALVVTLTDITPDEQSKQELKRIKEQTLSACEEVIWKQMRVAQEIASLLGETTAETKVNLSRLKDIVLSEGGGL